MLTTARVRELKPRDRMYEVTCDALPGFVVRVLPTGKKAFLVRRQVDGKFKREKIGMLGAALTVDEARRRAMLILGGAERNAPTVRPDALPAAPRPTRRVEPVRSVEPRRPTVRDLAARFVSEYIDVYLKPGTAFNYRRHLARHILPVLGDRDFDSVTRRDVQALHASLRHIPGTANYVLCVLGSLYRRITDDWELSDMRNPGHGVRRFKMRSLERFLTPDERRQLQRALLRGMQLPPGHKGHLDRMGVWALQLLSLTGLRRDEIRDLAWPMVDWRHECLVLHDTKTGPRKVPVPSQVITLLRHIHDQTGNPRQGLVVCSRTGRKLASLNQTWRTIREAVGIPDVRLHDLRHSFASDALMGGVPLAIVGEMLGHRHVSTTKRYAHLANRVVREALEQTAGSIVEASNQTLPSARASFQPLRDAEWEDIAPLVHAERRRGGKPVDLRRIVDGIRWVLHTGDRWTAMPTRYGASSTCWRWFNRWRNDGTWSEIEGLGAAPVSVATRSAPPRTRSSTGAMPCAATRG